MSGTWQAIGEITVDWMANWETMGWEEHIEAEPLRQTTCFPTSTRWPNREARLSGCLQRGIPRYWPDPVYTPRLASREGTECS